MKLPSLTVDRTALSRTTLSETLAQRITELIRERNLAVGDKLPSVKTLARTFVVATPTLREALRRLEAAGLIELRHGSGIYVRRADTSLMLPNRYYGELDIYTVLDLLEVRTMLEPELAARAAAHAAPADLTRLREIVGEAGRQLTAEAPDTTHLLKANEAFHGYVAQMSGNAVLGQMVSSLLELYANEQRIVQYLYNDLTRDHHEHMAIVAAVEAGQGEQARSLMLKHLSGVQAVIVNRIQEQEELLEKS